MFQRQDRDFFIMCGAISLSTLIPKKAHPLPLKFQAGKSAKIKCLEGEFSNQAIEF